MIIKVGTLVLCHLIISGTNPANQNPESGPTIKKIPGIVKEISEVEYIEMVGKDYAVKKKRDMILVEPEEKDQIFKVSADACRPVVDEETHQQLSRKKAKKESSKKEELSESKDSKNSREESAPSSSEKDELLKQLE